MELVKKICSHPLWKKSLEQIQEIEKERIFCHHDPEHFLNVARLAYIENLEKSMGIPKETIYAAAMLHDIGRHLQYLEKTPHEEASAVIAEKILMDCKISERDLETILHAIRMHRCVEMKTEESLAGIIYRADKKSRMCLFCPACALCDWSTEKKNMVITV